MTLNRVLIIILSLYIISSFGYDYEDIGDNNQTISKEKFEKLW